MHTHNRFQRLHCVIIWLSATFLLILVIFALCNFKQCFGLSYTPHSIFDVQTINKHFNSSWVYVDRHSFELYINKVVIYLIDRL